jgi:cytosine/adenosine deaminase-related metal-dependent hydrolase
MLSRRRFHQGLAAAALGASGILSGCAAASSSRREGEMPARGSYLIRGGAVVTVDPKLGSLARADVMVRDGTIVEIAAAIAPAPGVEILDATDMIVMPGLIDTHYHMWSALGRNFPGDRGFSYFPAKNAISPLMTPEDTYNSVLLGLAELANAGVTTVHNWSNNTRAPAHADAELRAHRDAMLRARYAYGHPDLLDRKALIDFADIDRVRGEWFGRGSALDGLVHLGVNLRGMSQSEPTVFHQEMEMVMKRGIPRAIHTGQSPPNINDASDYERRGYLGPDLLIAHYTVGSERDFEAMARTKTPLSFSTYSDVRLARAGDARAALMMMRKAGLTVSLSVDAAMIAPPNLFETMRATWNLGVPWQGTPSATQTPVDFAEILRMGTLNGAIGLGLGAVTGSITVGKRADLILVRTNDINMAPMGKIDTTVVQSANPENVDTVMVEGRILKRKGKLVGFDVERIVAQARASAQRLRSQVGGRLAEPT